MMVFGRKLLAAALVSLYLATGAGAQLPCVGDCDDSGEVTVDEILTLVNLALGNGDIADCLNGDGNDDGQITVDEILTAVNNALNGCPMGGEGLGVRRFSLDPTASSFEILGLPLALQSTTFRGFLDLEAGPENPTTGNRPIRILNAGTLNEAGQKVSDFLQIVIRPPIGAEIVVCIEPDVDSFPIEDAGELACNGSDMAGLVLRQDHNIGDVDPLCEMGMLDVNPNHAGVCNGPLETIILEGFSGLGALALAPDPETLEGGFPAIVTTEMALPCGDEGVQGFPAPLAVSTALTRGVIEDRNNVGGDTFTAERMGENFDCDDWTREDGPGRLVFAAPLLDFDTMVLGQFDVISVFTLDD